MVAGPTTMYRMTHPMTHPSDALTAAAVAARRIPGSMVSGSAHRESDQPGMSGRPTG
jgi:hypothetical protein